MTTLEKKVEELVKPIIENLGYSLYDVIYQKEGKDNYLRIFIDKKEGICLNDCELVNNSITDILDEKDYIKFAILFRNIISRIRKKFKKRRTLQRKYRKKNRSTFI